MVLICTDQHRQEQRDICTDHQIKIRGLRIELGEIESVLYAQKNINEAVVVAQEVKTSTRLVAFVSGRDINVEELKAHLVQVLPDYMVPNNILELEALPLSPNGKVDRKALPLIEVGINSNYVAPIGPVEQVLVDVWQKVLGIEKIGRQDNFFELGGDSIISLQIVALFARDAELVALYRGLHLELGALHRLDDLLRQIAVDALFDGDQLAQAIA